MIHSIGRRISKLGFGLLSSMLLAQAASAAVNITSATLDSPGGLNGTVSYAPTGLNEYGGIGRILMTGTDTATGAAVSYQTYCVDIFDWLSTPAIFTASSVSTLGLSTTKLSHLNALVSHADPLITNADQSAAVQIAIWEIINETGPSYNVDSLNGGKGVFYTSGSGMDGAISLANIYLGKVTDVSNAGWAAAPSLSMELLRSSGNQTQLVFGAKAASLAASAVPEPASWALMVVGFGALGATLRRKSHVHGVHSIA